MRDSEVAPAAAITTRWAIHPERTGMTLQHGQQVLRLSFSEALGLGAALISMAQATQQTRGQ